METNLAAAPAPAHCVELARRAPNPAEGSGSRVECHLANFERVNIGANGASRRG